jgi:hypothetical protein
MCTLNSFCIFILFSWPLYSCLSTIWLFFKVVLDVELGSSWLLHRCSTISAIPLVLPPTFNYFIGSILTFLPKLAWTVIICFPNSWGDRCSLTHQLLVEIGSCYLFLPELRWNHEPPPYLYLQSSWDYRCRIPCLAWYHLILIIEAYSFFLAVQVLNSQGLSHLLGKHSMPQPILLIYW